LVDLKPVEEEARHVMDSVYRQFGTYSIDRLNELVKKHPPYADAYAVAPSTEIAFESMVAFYGEKPSTRRTGRAEPTSAKKVMRPKVMRNATGKPVSVNRWTPKRVG
jgi:hypothetical protein